MAKAKANNEERHVKVHKRNQENASGKRHQENVSMPPIVALQHQVGNAAVQRLLAQRSGDGAFDLNEAVAGRINRARSNGHALDGAVQTKMGESMGADFSGVRVHTGSEAHELNEQLSAKAFTTGQDIFFRSGEYSPGSSSGQELIAHELTHVVQQGSGAVGDGGGAMRVNAPGDQFEQEADSVAKTVTSGSATPAVQRADLPEEEVQTKRVQRDELPEEEVQTKRLQRQEEDEEPVQMQADDEDAMVQKQELPEDEQEAVA